MFVGHFAIAFLLVWLFPGVPVWVPLVGVSFPDLLWGVLVIAGKEHVVVDPQNPLQRSVVFRSFPYSHSLVLTGAISILAGGALSLLTGDLAILPIFAMASSSHWVLDTTVHLPDLPVLGFDGDRKVGFGLWRRGGTAFVVELVLFVASAFVFVSAPDVLPVVAFGAVFHAVNANSFFGFNPRNPFGTPRPYAGVAIVGFAALSAVYSFLL